MLRLICNRPSFKMEVHNMIMYTSIPCADGEAC